MRSLVVGLAFAAAVFAADPFVGVWNINLGNTTNTDPAADLSTIKGRKMIYQAASQNSYIITAPRPAQGETRKMLARMDGKDYSNDSDGRDYEKDSALPSGAGRDRKGVGGNVLS
jgi:hypothetical protein